MSNTRTAKQSEKTASQRLAAAQRTQDSMTVNLPGPLLSEWKQVKELYDRKKAAQTAQQMLNPSPELKRLAGQLAGLEEAMAQNAIVITAQALRRERTPRTPEGELTWKELCKLHPPRKGKDGKPIPEDSPGVNMETFPEPLIRASIIGPDLSPEEWDSLLYEYMSDRQYDALFEMCWRLNKTVTDVPFSFAASQTLTRGTSSKRQSGSGSPASDSKAGNPSK